uniref:Uncharacterized protein n=1 Tax=Thermogemmatispora argillosa TaxID=2045280 RepID=A0A455T0J7_9CHLR|nr:hypothetical protein KTA_15770 [Thermogemmatispora argillosa]
MVGVETQRLVEVGQTPKLIALLAVEKAAPQVSLGIVGAQGDDSAVQGDQLHV